MFASEVLNSNNWRRKESYYINSPTNSLLEFELVLKEVKDTYAEHKGSALRKFCESFCSDEFNKNNEIKDECIKSTQSAMVESLERL